MHYFIEPTGDNPKYPCGICNRVIAKNHKFLRCNICNFKVHIKCNKTEDKTYINIQNSSCKTVICLKCKEENIPFFSAYINDSNEPTHEQLLSLSSIKMYLKGLNEFNNFQNNSSEDDSLPPISCKYEDVISFKYTYNKKAFSVFHNNIASLSKHKEELEVILNMLNFKFDVIGISESKLKKGITPDFDIKIKGYKEYSTPTESDKGGVLLYIAEHLHSVPRKDLDSALYKSYELESIFREIINPKKKNIIVGCIYKHPSMDLNEFNENYLNPLLDKLSINNKKIYLLGDFNADLLKTDIDSDISNFLDILTSNMFVPHITLPTRITPNSKTLIDNIFSNSINFSEGNSGNLTLSLSDHLAQFLIIPFEFTYDNKDENLFKRDTKHFDRENFFLDLLDIEWKSVINIEKGDPNFSFNNYEKTLNIIIDKYMPIRKLTKKEKKQQKKPWINYEIKTLIKSREKLYKKFIKAKDKEVKDGYYRKYKELRNKVVNLCKQSKKAYYQNFFIQNVNNIKKTWQGIKSIISINNKNISKPSSLMDKNVLITEPKKVANLFNDYFSTIAKKLQENIHHNGQDFNMYLDNPNDHSFFINPTNEIELINIINSFLSLNKAYGPHSIPIDIFHLIKLNVAAPLSEIINLTFEKGLYIQNLKISKIIPIFKDKGSNLQCINYRPISLLSNINKIVEKIMYKQLYNFFTKHNILYDLQYGFRCNHSTNHVLLDLTEDIRNAIDNNQFAVGIFLDLQKAFDTVDHNILVHKLSYYGIRGISNEWFKSYLNNRKQFVSIQGVNSNLATIECGVPQGSVLGPLLFLIYINDLHKAIKFSTTRHFADDTNLLIKNNSLKQLKKYLNHDLRKLDKWLKVNKISLNNSKTELIIFRHPNKKINYDLKIKLNGKRLYPSNVVKYLGIFLDSHLNWNYNSEFLATKLCRANGMLKKIRHYVPINILRTIYFSIFSSMLTFGSQIWGQQKNIGTQRILKLQDKAIRIINFSNYHETTGKLYKIPNTKA